MKPVTFITGNQHKAYYFAKLAGISIDHHGVDQPEIQSLDPHIVALEKAKTAFALLGHPVVVEDTALSIAALGKLPGTFIKWFIDELGLEKICRLADATSERAAAASSVIVYYDGHKPVFFDGGLPGSIPKHPKGDAGFGWNPIFIPAGQLLTLGQMEPHVFESYYLQIKPIAQVGKFLKSLDA
jgi:non-canonical purine NTP pyrophosphatase (RdgB/HAM1 family)